MKLELKHLAPYLPFYLKCHAMGEFKFGTEDSDSPIPETFVLNGLLLNNKASIMCLGQNELIPLYELFPILRPLSDLTKEIEIDGKKFVPIENIKKSMLIDLEYIDKDGIKSIHYSTGEIDLIAIWNEIADECPIGFYNLLLKWHFDVFSLIDKGLAIDINNL